MAKVLLACEYSGICREAFRNKGHDAYSCDILPSEDNSPYHIQDNVLNILNQDWDMMVAFPPCFAPGTLIKTSAGLKNIEDIIIGDKVLTHLNRYKIVYDRHISFSEKILDIKTLSSKLRVTHNHPFYTITRKDFLPKWTLAKDLTKDHFIGSPILNTIDNLSYLFTEEEMSDLPLLSVDFWWIVGKWVGDGWSAVHKKCYENIICSSYRPEEYEFLEHKIKSVFPKFSKEKQKTVIRYIIRNRSLFDFLNKFGKYCDGKYIPEFLFNLPSLFIQSFLNGYFFADGHLDRDGSMQDFCTVSKKLAYGLQLLIIKSYIKPTSFYEIAPREKKHFIDGREIRQNQSYRLKFNLHYKNESPNVDYIVHNNIIWSQIKKTTLSEYNNNVYNLSVYDDESYVANNSICHNCTHLAVSGARWFPYKQKEQKEAIDFFLKLINAPIPKIAIENPIGIMSTIYRKPEQIIQPWMFGESFSKSTCLWLKNLPLLKPTNIVDRGEYVIHGGKRIPKWYSNREIKRDRTFQGIGNAMASQWG